MSLRVFWHQVSPSNWSLGLPIYSRYDALSKFSCVPTASPSTAYSVGAAIALPYKTTYAKTTMPAPIAAAPILRRTRRLWLTSKRRVVGDGYDLAPPARPPHNISPWNCAATGPRPRSGSDCPAVCPIYHMAPSSIDTWNSRDVRRWVRAPLKQSHCTLLPLAAVTAPHGTRSSVNAGILARAPDRISSCDENGVAVFDRLRISPAVHR